MDNSIFDFILNVLRTNFDYKGEVTHKSHLQNEIDLDSINYMELINEVEEKFNFSISNEDLENPPETVDDLINLILSKKG